MQHRDQRLKSHLQRDELKRIDKILLVLGDAQDPLSISKIKERARTLGCPMDRWNVSDILARSGVAIRVPTGYEVSDKGRERLSGLGFEAENPVAYHLASELRAHLQNVTDPDTREFISEAISCYENKLYRSAIVMSWLSAVDVLKKEVIKKHLTEFNKEAVRINPKWKEARTADDLGLMQEMDFLNRLMAISVIGKNRKQQLEAALTLRNGCGHPNSLKVGPNQVAAHLECLLQNVFEVFRT